MKKATYLYIAPWRMLQRSIVKSLHQQ